MRAHFNVYVCDKQLVSLYTHLYKQAFFFLNKIIIEA